MADVSFTKKTWADGSSGGTPITASELNRMEQGIKDCADGANGLGDSISRGLRHIQGSFTFEKTAAGSISTKTITFSPAFDDIPLADACFAGEFNKAFAQCYVSVASVTNSNMVLRMVNGTTGMVTAPVRYQAWLGM